MEAENTLLVVTVALVVAAMEVLVGIVIPVAVDMVDMVVQMVMDGSNIFDCQ